MAADAMVPVARRWREYSARQRWLRAVSGDRLRISIAVMLLLAGVLIGVASWFSRPPAPYFLPLWVTAYRDPMIAPNPMADRDLRSITSGGYFSRVSAPVSASGDRHLLLQAVAGLSSLASGDSVVAYLSAYAAVDAAGEPYVMACDIEVDDPATRMPLRALLAELAKCEASHKLLILDLAWPIADARLGILSNDCMSSVVKLVKSWNDPHLLILCSSSPGQAALGSEALGQSVFGYYFQQALDGAADGYDGTPRDARVSARELASFVRLRVDRWARMNSGSRQTPMLLGACEDFDLRAVPHGKRPAPTAVALRTYPDCLRQAWQLRDLWQRDGSARLAPRLASQVEAVILRAERTWAAGGAPVDTERKLVADLKPIERQLDAFRGLVPYAAPKSVAVALTSSPAVDPGVATTLADYLHAALPASPVPTAASAAASAVGAAAPVDPKVKALLDKLEQAQPLDLAAAVVAQATSGPPLSPSRLNALSGVLRAAQIESAYRETDLLARLARASQSSGADEWPSEPARRTLAALALVEQAAFASQSWPWTAAQLAQTAQHVHDDQVYLDAPGCVSIALVERHSLLSAADSENLSARQAVVAAAAKTLDDAFALVMNTERLGDCDASSQPAWAAVCQAAAGLAALLDAADHQPQAGAMNQRDQLEAVRVAGATLEARLGVLRATLTDLRIGRLTSDASSTSAGPEIGCELAAVLSTPLCSADERTRMWGASLALSQRLAAATLALDAAEDRRHIHTAPAEDYPEAEFVAAEAGRADNRVARWQALWSMAGLDSATASASAPSAAAAAPTSTHDTRNVAPSQSPAAPNVAATGAAIRRAWTVEYPGQLARAGLAAADRASRIAPPWMPIATLDQPATNPTVGRHAQWARDTYAWLADWYTYDVRDLGATQFFLDAASHFVRASAMPSSASIEIDGPSTVPAAIARREVVSLPWLVIQSATAAGQSADITARIVDPADDRLRVELDEPIAPERPLKIRYWAADVSASSLDLPAQGFVVELAIGGRTFHRTLRFGSDSADDLPEILVSTEGKTPTQFLDSIRVRPTRVWQPYYIYIRNRSSKSRDVLVTLTAESTQTAKLSLAAGAIAQVPVSLTPPAAGQPPSELDGDIRVAISDPVSGEVLVERGVPVDIASPREYFAVGDIAFAPQSIAKNQLSVDVEQTSPCSAPCVAELVISTAGIPGLISYKAGTVRGLVPYGSTLTSLFAQDLLLSGNGGREGDVFINVDDYTRAFVFRTTFPTQGTPTTPREQLRPAIAVRAPQYAASGPGLLASTQVDNGPFEATLEVALGRHDHGLFTAEVIERRATPRQGTISIASQAKDGALLLGASVGDWIVPLDVTGLAGQRWIRARLLSAEGALVCESQTAIGIDALPPSGGRFVNLPSKISLTTPVSLSATAEDDMSGVASVRFFIGKPVDGKPPAGAPIFDGVRGTTSDGPVWTAQLKLPALLPGAVAVSAEFIDGVGHSDFTTAETEAVEGPVVPTGSITGAVTEGSRPQGGLEVALTGAKGAAVAKTTTGADGSFAFHDVPVGDYVLESAKTSTDRKGTSKVQVTANQTAQASIELLMGQLGSAPAGG